jgi:hypothetical protein
MQEGTEVKTIEYRLDKIDTQLNDLKTLMVNSSLQAKDIAIIYDRLDKVEKEQQVLREQFEAHEEQSAGKFEELKQEPIKQSAGRWNYIVDYVYKMAVAAVIGYLLVKWGLK